MTHMTLRGVQQSLAARGIRVARDAPYADGRCKFAVWPVDRNRITAKHTDDVEHAYILGLRLAH